MIPFLLGMTAVLLTVETQGAGRATAADQPKEVTEFIERSAACQHFLGEEPYDRERAAELAKAVRDLRCERLARDEKRLRRIYRSDPAVERILNDTADTP